MNRTITITINISTDRVLNEFPKLQAEFDDFTAAIDCIDAPDFIPSGGCFKYKNNVFQRCNIRGF